MIGPVLDALAGAAFRQDERGVLFAPFGDNGRQTLIPEEAFDRLWRETRLWSAPMLGPLAGMAVLVVGYRAFERSTLGWGLAAVLGSFAIFALLYAVWAKRATARLLAAWDEPVAPIRRRLVAEDQGEPLDRRRIGLELLDGIQATLTDGQGIHAESLLVATGALAGFACQMSVRRSGRAGELVVVRTADGRAFFLGDAINAPLLEAPDSIWRRVAEVPIRLGSSPPAIETIVADVVRSLGTPSFDLPDLPGHAARHRPLDYLQMLWPGVEAMLAERDAPPLAWPLILAYAAQRAVVLVEELVPPGTAVEIVMRCAVTIAKVDPANVRAPA